MKLLLAFLFAAAGLQAADFSLPDDEAQFTGPDADLLNGNCLACHDAEMVLLQPKMSAEAWSHSVAKMRNVYRAPITDEDAAKLPEALARVQAR
jgi:hypothetical protein